MLKEKIINLETSEVTFRDYSPEELAEVEAEKLKSAAIIEKQNTKAAEKAALLERLGITDDEAKLLLS